MLTKKMYKDAIDVQDACNIVAVTNHFRLIFTRIESALLECDYNPFISNLHPLSIMYTSKILSLSKGDLQPIKDLRSLPGWHLKLCIKILSNIFSNMRQLEEEEDGVVADSAFFNSYQLTRYIAVQMAELTYCESMDVFGKAYAACKYVIELDNKDAELQLRERGWLHHVINPFND